MKTTVNPKQIIENLLLLLNKTADDKDLLIKKVEDLITQCNELRDERDAAKRELAELKLIKK